MIAPGEQASTERVTVNWKVEHRSNCSFIRFHGPHVAVAGMPADERAQLRQCHWCLKGNGDDA